MKLYEICFSPTGGTKKAADMLAEEIGTEIQSVDLTDFSIDFSGISLEEDDIAVIAVPSYGGRVPGPAAERLSAIRGNGAKAVLVCVYGNRAYEDTLAELQDTAKQAGFRIVAAAAAVAEHSIARQFAAGRPDDQDRHSFVSSPEKSGVSCPAAICRSRRFRAIALQKKRRRRYGAETYRKLCKMRALCRKMSVQAIDPHDPGKVDSHACISCMRCISVCPHSARKVNRAMLAAVGAMLKKACSERKECELYI